MEKIAVFPGSFDPFTRGHENIILRALPLFDRIIIAIGENSEKKNFFPLNKRIQMIRKLYEGHSKVTVDHYQELTVEYCRQVGARFLLRGLRTAADFEFERAIAQVNLMMNPEVETIFLLSRPEYSSMNSTLVREILRYGGDVSPFIPENLDIG
ncbi:MAG: pantetheine-phosphate adenylyltransferase [Bacteroidales bacterium]|jgi:pantetheine-phosphate adenylyltransferase|nr:pantetheine-phosphate adenylyltransferase [Bacteroidales bacterium]MDD2571224.1 pantetheine-phosphate adenylyltransferase [Bacteroidales bacterium]MDD2812107.1 pantetheine-phosphate adenylyltransferase [Bacteroidales bacterium]MDD3384408.1 pantetheine-phosphate adenylyltransferase [Bacteroidales bacterium]MDD3811139.1 pantetheine-phosphate adenylyltransferase [Bacteroidales bacterium]